MFATLRHGAVVCGHDQQCELHGRDAGDHVVNEALVAGHVDKSQHRSVALLVGEAEIDRESATLFFRQAIRIDAGQRFDQTRLAVIDVPREGDDHGMAT